MVTGRNKIMKQQKQKIKSYSTHSMLRNVLKVAQCFSVFPLDGVSSSTHKELVFRWKSWRILYISLPIVACMWSATFSFINAVHKKQVAVNLGPPVFFAHALAILLTLSHISTNWPEFMQQLSMLESHLERRYPIQTQLQNRINIIVGLYFVLASVEHGLACIKFALMLKAIDSSFDLEFYFWHLFPNVFKYVPYNPVLGFILLVCIWICTFAWNFGDLFIILMSIIMSTKFKHITHRIRTRIDHTIFSYQQLHKDGNNIWKVHQRESVSDNEYLFWEEIREDYAILSRVCTRLNDLLGYLIIASYAGNSACILMQIFLSIKPRKTGIETVYFFVSFGYIIARTILVSIYGASVYEESTAPLQYLISAPTEIYNQEIQRLITQIHASPAALTGRHFFTLTRSLILSVAAAIVSYELVLMQFHETTLDKYPGNNNGTNA